MYRHPGRRVLIASRRLANVLGLRSHKVFAIGFNKTGTTSLHTLFESMALPSYHGTEWRAGNDPALLRRYDCFTDGPPADLARLAESFPRAKFILHVRELDQWVFSRLAHIEREKARGVHLADPGWDVTEESVTGWIVRRNAHHRRALTHFAQLGGEMLVVNFVRDPHAASHVCRFLGWSTDLPKPRENMRPPASPAPFHAELLGRALARLGVPEQECENDILCPTLLDEADRSRLPADTRFMARTTWP